MHEELTWREFEILVEDAFDAALDPDKWRIENQWERHYSNGDTVKRMDVHVAERRQGGRGFVIDAKHFKKSKLKRREVDTTLEYKSLCRASKAIIIVSDVTIVSDSAESCAEEMDVEILRANRNLRSNLERFFEDI
jgi:hypothetical protein